MTYLAPIAAPSALNHVRKPCCMDLGVSLPEAARIRADNWRAKRYHQRRLAIVQKARLRLKVPYDAWQRAWTLAGIDVQPMTGCIQVRRWWPLWELIDAYGYDGPLEPQEARGGSLRRGWPSRA